MLPEIFTKEEAARIFRLLLNGNADGDYVRAWRDSNTGKARFARAKSGSTLRDISWALGSIYGPGSKAGRIAIAPYARNPQDSSRWGGFDFDAHDGNGLRARRFAFAAFRLLMNTGDCVILETSGGGGWHIWSISQEFRPCNDWVRLMKGIALNIQAEIKPGICEIYPQDSLSGGLGKALRAPGSFHPGKETFSEIVFQDIDRILPSLPPFRENRTTHARDLDFSSPIQKETTLSFSLSLEQGMRVIGRRTEEVSITEVGTRHERLAHMVGVLFFQVAKNAAREIARCQFREKSVTTNASEEEHLEEFDECWSGLVELWKKRESNQSRAFYRELQTESEKDAFRIIQSFARFAKEKGNDDFPISTANLGQRVGITREGAGKLRKKFVSLGIIELTAAHRNGAAAARFRWLVKLDRKKKVPRACTSARRIIKRVR